MTRLLLYLSNARDKQRFAVGPSLAGLARAGGWDFDCYYADHRSGLHFGGGDPGEREPGRASGGLVAGGRHLDQILWLATHFEISALGDPRSPLWPALSGAGAGVLVKSLDPVAIYEAALGALGVDAPRTAVILDAAPQGPERVVVAPYLCLVLMGGGPRLGLEATASEDSVDSLTALGVDRFEGMYLGAPAAERWGARLSVTLAGDVTSYAALTAELARRYAALGNGVFLGDPDLVAAQLPRIARKQLIPLYGRPQTAVLDQARDIVRAASEPVYGRQYDDRDFFALAELGHGLQVVDPGPPFASAPPHPSGMDDGVSDVPSDAQLQEWAREGRMLSTLMFWAGMIREAECIPRVIDIVATTGLRCGVIVTAETVGGICEPSLALLSTQIESGGVAGRVDLVAGSTGWGVAAEASMGAATLSIHLSRALEVLRDHLPPSLVPHGWWPLLDTELIAERPARFGLRRGRPVLYFTPKAETPAMSTFSGGRRDLRNRAGNAVRKLGFEAMFEPRRPFDDRRPGALDHSIAAAVKDVGFDHMWTKSSFGRARVAWRDDQFVALPLTAGNWDGWSPFYTVSSLRDLRRARRRVERNRPGWIVGVIDTPLWLMSGEALFRTAELTAIARDVASGGAKGDLVNTTPDVVARYARIIDAL